MTKLRSAPVTVLVLALGILSACSSDSMDSGLGDHAPTGDFEIRSSGLNMVLIEGDEQGLRIPLNLIRSDEHDKAVSLDLRGRTTEDEAFVTSSFSRLTLTPSADDSEAVLQLDISVAPILPQKREFIISATDGTDSHSLPISVEVQPTKAPDIYLLIGQSNMEGFSGEGTRQAFAGGADESHPRIKQLNVSKNDSFSIFATDADYLSPTANIIAPDIVTALDPLHVPQDPSDASGKVHEYIGLGLSFAKAALPDTTVEVLLVPAAWSGSSFCANDNGPDGNWMASPSSNPALGNTLLFERAVTRANLALEKSAGVFRGMLWHQGESDANEACAPHYAGNLQQLVSQLRASISPTGDPALRRVDRPVPFVAGTMSRGVDERGDLSVYMGSKQMIDDAHRSVDSTIEAAAWSNHDDLIPANGYPCGNGSCIHFGPAALRAMGRRYYEALQRATGSQSPDS